MKNKLFGVASSIFLLIVIVVSVFLFIAPLGSSCKPKEKHSEEANEILDSMLDLIQDGMIKRDAIMLNEALKISERFMDTNPSRTQLMSYYNNRSTIFVLLNRMDEAYIESEKIVLLLDESHPQRLLFFGGKYFLKHNEDSSKYYLNRLIKVCEQKLNEKYDDSAAFYKIQAIFLLQGEDASKKYLGELLKKHPNGDVLRCLRDDWDSYVTTRFTNPMKDINTSDNVNALGE